MEAVLTGFAEITDPVEAEIVGSMFLGTIGFLGADAAEEATSELIPVIEAVVDELKNPPLPRHRHPRNVRIMPKSRDFH